MIIYHITTEKEWKEALRRGVYSCASLATEGFIHCSTREQLIETLNTHFETTEDLVLLHIHEKFVKHILKYEPSRDGALFPHIYGKLRPEMIENTSFIHKSAEGIYEFI